MVWADDRVIMFGGAVIVSGVGVPTDETWELVGDEWDQLSPAHSPQARESHQSAFDGTNVYIMGGLVAFATAIDNTWKYVAGDWSQISIATPIEDDDISHPYQAVMCWVTIGNRLLAFIPTFHGNRTWEYSAGLADWVRMTLATEWVDVAAGHAERREDADGAWCDDRFVVVAGGEGNGAYSNDVFEFDGTDWSRTVAYSSPYNSGVINPWRFRHRAVWTGDQLFVFGGAFNTVPSTGPDTLTANQFVYDPAGSSVANITTVATPPALQLHAMVWDGTRVILFGGELGTGGSLSDETWVLEPPFVPPPPIVVAPTYQRVYGMELTLDDNGVEGPVTVRTSAQSQQA